jgi:hypothetical protein
MVHWTISSAFGEPLFPHLRETKSPRFSARAF